VHTGISAVQHLRPLRGGAHSHLLRASDGACYVTKFQNMIPNTSECLRTRCSPPTWDWRSACRVANGAW
jgi:hypothetical protein